MSTRHLLWPLLGLAGLVHAGPLTYSEALELAERRAPDLDAGRARIEAAAARAIPADALPDPKLFAGIDNLPVSGPNRWSLSDDFMTMQKIGVMQEVPNADKRRARGQIAEARVALARAEERVTRLMVQREAARAWLNRHFLEQRLALFEALDRENRLLADTVRARIVAGQGPSADALLPEQEAAELADRRDLLASEIDAAKAALRRWIGEAADEPLAGDPAVGEVAPAELRHRLHTHPELAVFDPLADVARGEVRAAQAEKVPDWGWQFAYQRRPDFGDMVMFQVTVDLPLFSATRQDPLIAAQQKELARVEAEREAMLREHGAELEQGLARHAALTRQLARADDTWVPLAQRRVELALADYRAGKGGLEPVLAARRELVEARLRAIGLATERAELAAELKYAYGEDLR